MKKLIIHFEGMTELEAIAAVSEVIKMGRISKARNYDQYCFVINDFFSDIRVYALEKRNEQTDTFKVQRRWN